MASKALKKIFGDFNRNLIKALIMKAIFTSFLIILLISCSHLKEKAPKINQEEKPQTDPLSVPDYSGDWVAEGEKGSKWSLKIFEETYQEPIRLDPNDNDWGIYAGVIAILKFEQRPETVNGIKLHEKLVYTLSGSRVLKNRLLLGTAFYEYNFPSHTYLLKIKIPDDLSNGFDAWFEHARTGLFPGKNWKPHVNNDVKLHFKRPSIKKI